MDSWIPTDIELPHFGRLPIRVLVCDALSCRAQGSHTEHSVNLTIPEVTTMSAIRTFLFRFSQMVLRLNCGRFLINSRGMSTQFLPLMFREKSFGTDLVRGGHLGSLLCCDQLVVQLRLRISRRSNQSISSGYVVVGIESLKT